MSELNLSDKILKQIKNEHIAPRPRWQFALKNILLWTIGFVALLFGGLASSVVVYMLVNNDWDVYEHITGSLPEFIFVTMPYYWLVFVLVFIVVAHYYLKHTKRGYRYKLRTMAAVIISSSLLLGILFYNIGMGKAIEEIFTNKVPFYGELIGHRKHLWDMADQGRVVGEIITVINENGFRLQGMDSREWLVIMPETIVSPPTLIKEGNVVKIMGNKLNEENFEAFIIRPMGVPFGHIFENRRRLERHLMEHPETRQRMRNMHFMPGGPASGEFERNEIEPRNTIIEGNEALDADQ